MEEKSAANQLYADNKLKESILKYTEGIERVEAGGSGVTPEDAECLHLLYCNRSKVHLDLAMVEEALQDAERGIDAKANYGKAYARRAAVLIEMFQFKNALEDIQKAEELDPTLAAGLLEASQRATGKKWVASCFAQQQKESQKKHRGSHYVLRFLTEEGSSPLQDGTIVGEGGLLVVPVRHPNSGAEHMLRRGFEDAYRSGKPSGIFNIYQTLLTMDLPAVKDQVGGYGNYKKLLGEQIQREFGQIPKERVPVPVTTAGARGGGGSAPVVSLYKSITTAQAPTTGGSPRRFYPGGPKWMTLPNFTEVVRHDWPEMNTGRDFETAKENIMDQRKSDACYRLLNQAYAEAGGASVTKLSIAEHKKIYHSCGLAVRTSAKDSMELTHKDIMNQRVIFQVAPGDHAPTRQAGPTKCDHCDVVIKDVDPPECICGEIYCSDACHEADWPDHQSICDSVSASQQGALGITEYYWGAVFKGYFPCKDEPDFVAQWKQKAKEEGISPSGSFEEEFAFYMGAERDLYANQVGEMQGPFKLAMGGSLHGRKKEAAITNFFDAVLTQMTRMTTPFYCDSAARLSFKLTMSEVYYRIGQDLPPSIMRMPSRDALKRTFEPLIKQRMDNVKKEGGAAGGGSRVVSTATKNQGEEECD